MSVSPLSKNSRSCSAVKCARRNSGAVRIAKYGSRAANASQRASGRMLLFEGHACSDNQHPRARAAGKTQFRTAGIDVVEADVEGEGHVRLDEPPRAAAVV